MRKRGQRVRQSMDIKDQLKDIPIDQVAERLGLG
jgi:hypothetical protein